MPGVRRLVQLPAFAGSAAGFAIVADSHWQAQQAVQAVEVEWLGRPQGPLDTRAIAKDLEQAVKAGPGHAFHARGDVEQAERSGSRTIEAWYSAPYLAHATLEPMNATARVSGGSHRDLGTHQVPQMCRGVAAGWRGCRSPTWTCMSRCWAAASGRRLEVDYVAQAVRIAMDLPGVPVQAAVVAEEDTAHDFYRPMHVARLRATFDGAGQPAALQIRSAGDAITPRWIERGMPALPGRSRCPTRRPPKAVRPTLWLCPSEDGARLYPFRCAGGVLALRRPFAQCLFHRVRSSMRLQRSSSVTRWSCAAG
jgi:isoquinoline 1-oxidoreductase beta subunit